MPPGPQGQKRPADAIANVMMVARLLQVKLIALDMTSQLKNALVVWRELQSYLQKNTKRLVRLLRQQDGKRRAI
jgi:hypothetical protein